MTALAIVLLAIILRTDALTVRDPARVGGPPAVPVTITVPFVTAPGGLFTPATVADAERRLAAVFASTGVEATFLVQAEQSTGRVSAPEGWPDRFDRDGHPDRDVLAVFGIAPDGTPVCCLTLMGDSIIRARDDHLWHVLAQPGALDDDLAEPTANVRDGALIDFVRGIEDMAPSVATVEKQGLTNEVLGRSLGLLAIAGPLLLLVVVGLRGRALGPISQDRAAPMELGGTRPLGVPTDTNDVSSATVAAPSNTAAAGTTASVVAWAGGGWGSWSDRRLVFVSLAAVTGLGLIGVVDLLLPPSASVRLDDGVDGMGRAVPGVSILPFVLAAIAVGSLAGYARQGRWLRRIAVAILVGIVGWTIAIAVDHTVPASADRDRGWVTGQGAEVSYALDGLSESVTYRLSPGDSFTVATKVRNAGVLPLTVLGLEGTTTTQPNPHVGSITSLGWVVQPTDGRITYLSANPEDASATWPVTLAPGEELAIAIIARAGPCASPTGTAQTFPLARFPVAYRVIGIRRTVEVEMPASLWLTSQSPCTVDIPGGTVTYGTPAD